MKRLYTEIESITVKLEKNKSNLMFSETCYNDKKFSQYIPVLKKSDFSKDPSLAPRYLSASLTAWVDL